MATITMRGKLAQINGQLPKPGKPAPSFTLTRTDLSSASLNDYKGKKVVLNIFPSIDTGVCAQSVRKFNEEASKLEKTKVLCISRDLPFAQARFCAAEGLENVESLSDFKDGNFGKAYGIELRDGAFQGLHARAVVVLDEEGHVVYNQLVPDIGQEPDYTEALKHVQ
ncbi:MAG: thiol peroxidase [Flavobacteriaceae bacterium]